MPMNDRQTKKILVTGGAGFIGTHLCRALVQMGKDVHVLDLKAPTTPIASVHYVRGDVRDPEAVKAAVNGVSAVYHLAAIASVPLCQERPYESTQTNLTSTALLLESMPSTARFIFSGSCAVYGDSGSEGERLKESRPIENLASFYAAQKLGSEEMIRQFHRAQRIPAVTFRFFNVFGPGQDPKSPYTGVITAFSEAIRAGRPLKLNGGGFQTRDFISVYDVVKALTLALECPVERCDAHPINLGTGTPTSIRNLAVLMRTLTGSQVDLEDAPWREGDIRHSTADNRQAFEKMGWKSEVSLEKGLKELLNPDITPLTL